MKQKQHQVIICNEAYVIEGGRIRAILPKLNELRNLYIELFPNAGFEESDEADIKGCINTDFSNIVDAIREELQVTDTKHLKQASASVFKTINDVLVCCTVTKITVHYTAAEGGDDVQYRAELKLGEKQLNVSDLFIDYLIDIEF